MVRGQRESGGTPPVPPAHKQKHPRAAIPGKIRKKNQELLAASPTRFVFFLGGHDLEMRTIRDLLAEVAADRYYDKGLSWGAKTSAYREEIAVTLDRGRAGTPCAHTVAPQVPVLVELTDDLGLDPARVLLVDHHGERAGENQPTSLHQVFDLLGLPLERWTRWYDLVAANDRGYIPALVELGATPEEIVRVRAADRAAQGITAEEEAAGERAVAYAEILAHGRLTVVHLSHGRTATVTDRLHPALGGPGYENLLVYCPKQVNFFGAGELVLALDKTFPGGWYGGALPDSGFWGYGAPLPDIMPGLLGCLEQEGRQSCPPPTQSRKDGVNEGHI